MEFIIIRGISIHNGFPRLVQRGKIMNNDSDDFEYLDGPLIWSSNTEVYCKPDIWYFQALSLRNSADVIFEEHFFPDENRKPRFIYPNVEKMLYGFSLECLIKAIIIKKHPNPKEIFENNRVHNFIKTHKLLELIKKINFVPNKYEAEILEELTACSTWAGRYPIPSKAEDLPAERKPETKEMFEIKTRIRWEKHLSEGGPWADLSDRLHGGLGTEGKKQIDNMYEKLISIFTE